jgi:shikimate kinase
MNIVLMGYRGSGKTTIGRKIAEELWSQFADTDALVCERFGGATIREIWEQHGEAAFRQAESQVVKDLLARTNQVIALGGGTVMQPEARDALQSAAGLNRIYLKCDPQELYRRIQADTQTAHARPALSGLGGSLEEIRQVLAEREPVYEALATQVFDTTHCTPEDAVMHIIRRCL